MSLWDRDLRLVSRAKGRMRPATQLEINEQTWNIKQGYGRFLLICPVEATGYTIWTKYVDYGF